MIELAASILSANFAKLGAELDEAFAARITRIHVDVMDGQFVPNLSMGPEVVRAVKSVADRVAANITAHLMIVQPERFIESFVRAGAHGIMVHVEQAPLLTRTLERIRELGAEASVAINPATPIGALEEVLDDVASVLVMSVDPGFGGQPFNRASLVKVKRLRALLDQRGLGHVRIAVDGGVNEDTILEVAEAGANCAIVGSALFNAHRSVAENVKRLRDALSGGRL